MTIYIIPFGSYSHHIYWVNYNHLITTSPQMMVSTGTVYQPKMALSQASVLSFTQIHSSFSWGLQAVELAFQSADLPQLLRRPRLRLGSCAFHEPWLKAGAGAMGSANFLEPQEYSVRSHVQTCLFCHLTSIEAAVKRSVRTILFSWTLEVLFGP